MMYIVYYIYNIQNIYVYNTGWAKTHFLLKEEYKSANALTVNIGKV